LSDLPNENEIKNVIETKVIRNVGQKVVQFFIKNYSKEGYFQNNTFVPWSQRKKDTKKPLLYDTGDMKKSFTVAYPVKGEFTVSNTAEYSKYHQEGTDKMPKRPILYDDKQVEEIIEGAVFDELDKLFAKFKK
jgi:phage gpG-like protein